MLPPHPLPVVPQAVEPPPPLPARRADCRWPLFCLGWDFWFWSCGLLFRSNVCAQPKLTRNREQESARRKKFFFTGPPFVRVAERTPWPPGSTHATKDLAKAACPSLRQQLCSYLESRCDFRAEGLLAGRN